MPKNTINVIVPGQEYWGGDTIYGVVELNVGKSLKSRGIRLLFVAFEYTHWTETIGNTTYTYIQRRIFLSHRFDLAGTSREQRKHAKADIVDIGTYRWPFAIALPPLIPPTCKFQQGKIEYTLSAYVDIPMAFDLKNTLKLNVRGNLFDQVVYSMPTPPVHKHSEKKFLFSSGKLKLEASLPKFHFFVGDMAIIDVNIRNESKKPVDSIKVSLMTKKVFFANSHSTISTSSHHKNKFDIKVQGKSHHACSLQYHIPINETPTTANMDSHVSSWHPQLVKIYHYLRVRLDVPWAIDLSIDIPIALMRINPHLPIYAAPPPQIPAQQPVYYGVPVPASPTSSSDNLMLHWDLQNAALDPNYNASTLSPRPSHLSPHVSPLGSPSSPQAYPFGAPPPSYSHPYAPPPYDQQALPPTLYPQINPPHINATPISLQKTEQPYPAPSSAFPPPTPAPPLASPPSLPQPPYAQAPPPTQPGPRKHLYPVLSGYQYPQDMDAILLTFDENKDEKMDAEEMKLIE